MLLSLSMEAIQPGEADEGKHNYILKPNSHGRRFSSLNHLKNLFFYFVLQTNKSSTKKWDLKLLSALKKEALWDKVIC